MARVLGISASLRNARFGYGSELLCKEIHSLKTKEELVDFLKKQTKIRIDEFIKSGRDQNKSFDIIYNNLKKLKGDRGLSNSEAALTAGLWGALQQGAEIDHCGLSSYFPASGRNRKIEQLRIKILISDAILLSGPVYFGDRGSLAQSFIEFLTKDEECRKHLVNKVYGGITVGAKRNGGQETTLIYQLIDTTNMNMLAVGNDSETTSQYGGTAKAGDVGTLADDNEGIDTSIGTGRRIAHISRIMEKTRNLSLKGKVRVSIWLLQDSSDSRGKNYISQFCRNINEQCDYVNFRVMDFTREEIYRCIACDICPTDVGPPEDYRCIITAKNDLFVKYHQELINTDAILLAAYSPIDRRNIHSVYQQFIERTRYLRRDDYVFGDVLVAPFVISEVGANQNLHIRMLTSMIRHHTVLHHPIIGFEHENVLLNWEAVNRQGLSFVKNALYLSRGKLNTPIEEMIRTFYNPIGYRISMEKANEDFVSGKKEQFFNDRMSKLKQKVTKVENKKLKQDIR